VLITSAATRTWLGPLYAQNSCAVPVITSLAIYTRPFGVAITTFWNYSLVMPFFLIGTLNFLQFRGWVVWDGVLKLSPMESPFFLTHLTIYVMYSATGVDLNI
jgi:hypothetical protein